MKELTYTEPDLAEYLYIVLTQITPIASLSDGNCHNWWELSLREGKGLAQTHRASGFQSLDSNPGLSTIQSAFLPLENGLMLHMATWRGYVVWGEITLMYMPAQCLVHYGYSIPPNILLLSPSTPALEFKIFQRAREVLK